MTPFEVGWVVTGWTWTGGGVPGTGGGVPGMGGPPLCCAEVGTPDAELSGAEDTGKLPVKK